MDWNAVVDRQRARYEEVEMPVLLGNAAYGAGLASLMLSRDLPAFSSIITRLEMSSATSTGCRA
jgi:hypothetical protein